MLENIVLHLNSGESFELTQNTKSLEHKIMELEGQVQNLEQTSSEKDTLIEKYKIEIKEGKCLSQCDEKCPCIYRLHDCHTEMALELSQLKQKLKSAKV